MNRQLLIAAVAVLVLVLVAVAVWLKKNRCLTSGDCKGGTCKNFKCQCPPGSSGGQCQNFSTGEHNLCVVGATIGCKSPKKIKVVGATYGPSDPRLAGGSSCQNVDVSRAFQSYVDTFKDQSDVPITPSSCTGYYATSDPCPGQTKMFTGQYSCQ